MNRTAWALVLLLAAASASAQVAPQASDVQPNPKPRSAVDTSSGWDYSDTLVFKRNAAAHDKAAEPLRFPVLSKESKVPAKPGWLSWLIPASIVGPLVYLTPILWPAAVMPAALSLQC